MKIDLDAVLRDLDGKPMKSDASSDSPNATLKSICLSALMASLPDEQHLPGTEKIVRYKLAIRIHDGGSQEFTPEEVTKMRDLIGKVYTTLVVGRAFDMLDPKAEVPNGN